jgi:hypothetical protein
VIKQPTRHVRYCSNLISPSIAVKRPNLGFRHAHVFWSCRRRTQAAAWVDAPHDQPLTLCPHACSRVAEEIPSNCKGLGAKVGWNTLVAWSVCPTAQENNKTQGRWSPVAAPTRGGAPMVMDRRCPWLMPAGRIAAWHARGARALWMSCCVSRRRTTARASLPMSAPAAAT